MLNKEEHVLHDDRRTRGTASRTPCNADAIRGSCEHTNAIMSNTLWLNMYPWLSHGLFQYTAAQPELFFGLGC
jgi:hypothetical protein